ncbi:putative membrane protein [Collimonas fungivorans]|uniref:Putative membrane protein n=1 Tax=Collimonas fungivorans TaxID=158899 RepID=A0A127P736_9BURK|nr:putative membrane protein [Collimonas fungivorans]
MHDELHIPQWRDVLTHGALLMIVCIYWIDLAAGLAAIF